MEVIAVDEDKFWLHEGGPVPSEAEEYDGPPRSRSIKSDVTCLWA